MFYVGKSFINFINRVMKVFNLDRIISCLTKKPLLEILRSIGFIANSQGENKDSSDFICRLGFGILIELIAKIRKFTVKALRIFE